MCLLQLSLHVTLSINILAQHWSVHRGQKEAAQANASPHACLLSAFLFCATRALLQELDHTFGLSLLLWVLSFPTIPTLFKPVLPTQTPQLDSHERLQPEGHRRCAKLYNSFMIDVKCPR